MERYASSERLEAVLLLFAVTSAISDVTGGEAFNFSLALFSLLVVWGKNARGALFAQGFIALALILDIVYFSVNPRRNPTSLAFQALTFIEKVAAAFFMHFFLHELGAGYSWSTPVTGGAAGSAGGSTMATPFTGAAGGGGDERPKAPGDGDATADAAINFSTYQQGGAVSYQARDV